MSDFRFNEENNLTFSRTKLSKKKKGLTKKLIDWGLAKNESQAQLYMIGFIIIGFMIIVYLNLNTFSSPKDISDPVETELIP